jgi:polar amino acid transport system substrate-binding protein
MSRRLPAAMAGALSAVIILATVAGCGSDTYAPTRVAKAAAAAPATANPGTATPTPAATGAAVTAANCLKSYAPQGALPAPDALPSGSTMERIRKRGYLKAGVSADTLLLGARNPVTGTIEGFDIDVLHALSRALFGAPDKIELRVITAADRESVLKDDSVDVVARAMTINCDRWTRIAFSTEYYRAGQKVLVPLGSRATTLADLKGKRVCAPTKSTSLDRLRQYGGVVPVPSDSHTGCLVLFQQGKVDAITGDDTVLAGLAAQDPYARVVGRAFSAEPYGVGVNQDHVDLARFVNGVLQQMRTDGRLAKSYDRWLRPALGPLTALPTPVYGRS